MPTPLAAARAHFAPARGLAYLDAGTFGLPPRRTVAAMREALAAWQRGTADWVEAWDQHGDACRALFGALIGAPAERVALLPSVSVGAGLVAATLGPGDEVVVPDDEFTSVLFPLLVAEHARGVRVRCVPFGELAAAVGPRTTLVAFSLVQSHSGRVASLASILAAAGQRGARVFVDATHAVPFVPVADHLPRIDYLACAAYKHLLCPRGVTFLYVAPERLADTPSLTAGWRSARDPYGKYYGGPLDLAPSAARFDVSLAWFSWVGASQSLRLLSGWQREGLLPEVVALADRLADALDRPRTGSSVLSVPVRGAPEKASAALQAAGVRASVRAGAVRFAPHVYNTPQHVARAARAIRPFLAPR